MNPWRAPEQESDEDRARRFLRVEQDCMKCHDQDNDVHWNFEKKWPFIVHRER
jgi:hypothetical protein